MPKVVGVEENGAAVFGFVALEDPSAVYAAVDLGGFDRRPIPAAIEKLAPPVLGPMPDPERVETGFEHAELVDLRPGQRRDCGPAAMARSDAQHLHSIDGPEVGCGDLGQPDGAVRQRDRDEQREYEKHFEHEGRGEMIGERDQSRDDVRGGCRDEQVIERGPDGCELGLHAGSTGAQALRFLLALGNHRRVDAVDRA